MFQKGLMQERYSFRNVPYYGLTNWMA